MSAASQTMKRDVRDSELTERPGRDWTPWKEGIVDLEIDHVW
ncbi:hypothetical protein [Mesorhizobium huakuii]|uniref:Uncharacterized protein n=1 Tax=Mesorhizobium huakuii TaxID=28104 RepID=A0ABZ0VSV0_9HYPH|nr:hypothetical protein [Mesorhizobium huakuii]WQB98611.1 hypothetical protein U0R22_002768 [Mesorhizobium huakuii]